MVLNEEKRAKLPDARTRRQGVSWVMGTSAPHALVSATVAPSPIPFTPIVAVPLAAAQASPTPPPCERRVVEIESDEDSAKGPVFKRLKPTTPTASHSSTAGHPTSLRDQTPNTSSPPDLFALEDGSESAPTAPSALELSAVLHVLKGF